MSAIATAYGHICEALDSQSTLLSFLSDQLVEWGRSCVDRLDTEPDSSDIAVLPLPARDLTLSEKAMVLVVIYNARCAGRSPIVPASERTLEAKILARVQTLIEGQAYDMDDDEFGMTTDDLPTIRSYVKDVRAACSVADVAPTLEEVHAPVPVAESSATAETTQQRRDVVTSPQTVQPVGSEPEEIITTVRSDRTASNNEDKTTQLIAALVAHHDFNGSSVGNSTWIGCRELATAAKVGNSTASKFFNRNFRTRRDDPKSGNWKAYKELCKRSRAELVLALQALTDELPLAGMFDRSNYDGLESNDDSDE